MDPTEERRARFGQLPEPVRREQLVETTDADPPRVTETEFDTDQRLWLAAGGGSP
jgi:hypothetical protein